MMDNPYITTSAVFLIDTVFGLYILAIMLRLLFQWVRADFYNPFSQFLVKITNPVLRPARRIVPGLWGIDFASIVVLFLLQIAEVIIKNVTLGQMVSLPAVAMGAVSSLGSMLLTIYTVSILLQVILSWIGPGSYHPLSALLYSLNEPVLRPARRLIPLIGGIDLSPMLALIAIQLFKILIIAPIADLSLGLR